MNGLTVIIPSKNVLNLWGCLPAIKALDSARVIVVDDGVDWPTNGSAEWNLSAWGVKDVIGGVKPFVFARNVNLGIVAAGTDDVILANDDCILRSKVGVHDGCFVDHGSLTSSFRGKPQNQLSFQQNAGLFRQKWGVSPT